jgi:hypothetical protein
VRVGELVADASSVLLAMHDSCALEDGEVLGDVLLRRVEGVGEFLDRAAFERQERHNPKPDRLAEDA